MRRSRRQRRPWQVPRVHHQHQVSVCVCVGVCGGLYFSSAMTSASGFDKFPASSIERRRKYNRYSAKGTVPCGGGQMEIHPHSAFGLWVSADPTHPCKHHGRWQRFSGPSSFQRFWISRWYFTALNNDTQTLPRILFFLQDRFSLDADRSRASECTRFVKCPKYSNTCFRPKCYTCTYKVSYCSCVTLCFRSAPNHGIACTIPHDAANAKRSLPERRGHGRRQ